MIPEKLLSGEDLSDDESYRLMAGIMDGEFTDSEISAALTALRVKGESVSEIVGAMRALQERMLSVENPFESTVDMCGTGGDGKGTFNISTAASFVVAVHAPVAKHGNRALTSTSGSADVLKALGLNIDITPERKLESLKRFNWTFLFAPAHHPAMKRVAGVRRELGFRTIFNILGPLVNPVGVKRHFMGVFSEDMTEKIAGVFQRMDYKHAAVVYSTDGYDEISPYAPTHVVEVYGEIRRRKIEPDRYVELSHDDITVKSPEESARLVLQALSGQRGTAYNAVVLNAAMGLSVALDVDYDKAFAMAVEAVDSGRALARLEELKEWWK